MKRVLVVGPGPLLPGIGPGQSRIAAELAGALADGGLDVVAVDSAPTSYLLAPDARWTRWVEPLRMETIARIVEREKIDAVTVAAAGRHVVQALARHAGPSLHWLGGAPTALWAACETATAATRAHAGTDAVLASDGEETDVLGVFADEVARPFADSIYEIDRDRPSALERPSLAKHVGLVTVRVTGEVVACDPLDASLWLAAGRLRGVRIGTLLARLLVGESLATALRDAARPAEHSARAKLFATIEEGAESAIGPKAIGRTARLPAPAIPPREEGVRRVLLVAPGAVRPTHGAEASLAVALAARTIAELGHEIVLAGRRADTGAPARAARWHTHPELHDLIEAERPTDILLGFGADPALLVGPPLPLPDGARIDVGERALARKKDVARAPSSPNAIEVHAVVLAGGGRARLLGTFEHVERAAVSADDAAAVSPSLAVGEGLLRRAEDEALALAIETEARGVVTVRFAIAGNAVEVIGIDFGITTHALSLGLTAGVDVVGEAVRVALGDDLDEAPRPAPRLVAVEEHVFPFAIYGVTDTKLDRSARSTGSVLGLADTTARAYAKALAAMGISLRRPKSPGDAKTIVLSGADGHATALADVGKRLFALGFDIVTDARGAAWLAKGRIPHRVVDELAASAKGAAAVVATGDAKDLRHAALVAGVTCFTTVELAAVAVKALEEDDPFAISGRCSSS